MNPTALQFQQSHLFSSIRLTKSPFKVNMPMPSRHLAAGLLSGVGLAIGFARFIATLPPFHLLEAIPLLCLHGFGALCGLIVVETIAMLLQSRGPDKIKFYLVFAAGATLFNCTALLFLPDLYGQTDLSLTPTAAALLFSVGTFSIAVILRLAACNKLQPFILERYDFLLHAHP